ncbi:hypothetical protein GCM10023189_48420 [Nibrella saemangeumensis]|uniref:Lipoxygenase domain-containing protein n=1 Tax=Nibrella saemangeumensis TaxID=1084526 RepID=A0ABP8NJE6_9BACT
MATKEKKDIPVIIDIPQRPNPPVVIAFDETPAEKICQECYEKTKIGYRYGGGFFTPRLKSINHLEVGRSKIISNPFLILAEWLYVQYKAIRDWWQQLKKKLFPRRDKIYGHHMDSQLVGRITFAKRGDLHVPIHNMRVEFWARTWWWQWRKLSAGLTDQDGYFSLPFDLRTARSWKNRKVQFEIYQTTHIYFKGDEPVSNYALFQVTRIPKSDLVGMSYNLRTIQLFYWEYRTETPVPRVVIKDHDWDAPQYYSQGRTDAMYEQMMPVELTKVKHLDQIELAPETITLQEIQNDYPLNLTGCIEKKLPGYTRSDHWFGQRMMNGMNAAHFLPDKAEKDHYWVKYFGACNYEVNDEYAFPTAEIKFKLKSNGLPTPVEIHLTGPLNAFNKDPWQKHVFTPADGEKWLQAKRVARVNGGLCTELDEHLTATHLNTEQYAIAAYRNLRLSPVACLLLPHLKEVVLIDHTADKILINDYIPRASAMTANGCGQRARDLLGAQDWKGWMPMRPISDAHKYAKAENLFWEMLGDYIEDFFEKNQEGIRTYWFEVYRFSTELLEHGVPLYHATVDLDKLSPEERDHEQKRLEYYAAQYRLDTSLPRMTINGEVKALSPITTSPEYDPLKPEDMQNLKDACRYIIMMATFMHTWVNEHQYEDIGEVLYSCLGLRFGDKVSGVMAPESDLSIAPDLTRSTQMMWFSNLLSRTEYGFITRDEEGDINPVFSRMLLAKKEAFAKLGVNVDDIESRTNI